MELLYRHSTKYLLFLSILFISVTGIAQKKSVKPTAKSDTLNADSMTGSMVSKLKRIGDAEAGRSILKFNTEKETLKQEHLLEDIRREVQRSKSYIKTGIDTTGMKQELDDVNTLINVVGDGVLTHRISTQTYRNLTTTSKLLAELLKRANLRKEAIDKHEKILVDFRYKIDSLFADPVIYRFPKDSVDAVVYAHKLINVVGKEINPMDTLLQKAISSAHKLQTQVNRVVNKLTANLDEIDQYQSALAARIFDREFNNLGDDAASTRPFDRIVYHSDLKAELTFWFYAKNHIGEIILVLLLICASTAFLTSLKQIVSHDDAAIDQYPGQLLLRYPILSAISIMLCTGQFIFTGIPFVFNCLFWIISAICLTVIFSNFISRYWLKVWLVFVVLFIISCLDNMILQASPLERWGMLVLAAIGVIVGIFALANGHRDQLRQRWILYFIGLSIVLELGCIVADVFGRYNLSKSLLVAGYLGVVVGILFLWVIRLINEGLYLASKAYTKQDRRLFYINFNVVGEKAPTLFYLFLIIGWFILFGRNFYVFKFISEPLKQMFFEPRTIGNYTFSISSLIIFVAIITAAIVVSKTVSYFTSESDPQHLAASTRRPGIGSWILLIRVGIIGLGTFLAFAAAGFPTDRIALIIGALGVGIGFGLQTLVQNLVSGVIIAFEKPVNVGDIVEIGGQMGTMKSIGFRSSILSKMDGPDMVIPNGDLLNSHLTNWTLAGSKRQMDLTVGVAYGTDLQKTQEIVATLLDDNERIHRHPQPLVFFQNFGDNSIDMRLLFWVREFKDGTMVKSDVIKTIDKVFKANDIVIPFPQQDVYLHQTDKTDAQKEIEEKKPVKRVTKPRTKE
ncbi:mechanosensitive ion channel family protein [Mucilaginibacter agri]|uniref:Mechanosensitive ion channel n=1 Tax=Mucilaginibacter agri TaxID=2695265 RepID=A0A965ZJE6_9SPHI|nr:mechanosensitive ion channel domain-containing protein [Mucilaginibacter agri]NCD71157.1 mechanosensitive ion channel [Mucilaginibacter agri]